MAWIAVIGLLLAVFVVVYLARRNLREPPEPTASVIVDMDDELPAEIDFDSGIEAGRRALEPRSSKED